MRKLLFLLFAAVCLLADGARAETSFLELVTADASQPSFLADPGDGRLFISQLDGYLRIFANGVLQEPNDAFLFLNDVALGGESGFHSFAFDPDFSTNRYVYVAYTKTGSGVPLERVIARYTALANDPNHADPDSRFEILHYPSGTASNHKGGQIQFGPDGMLYFAFGDGGSQDNPDCGAQEHDTLLGKVIRIDPRGDDFPNDANNNYAIPPTNPFAAPNDSILDEIWASGLRNPYRFSFDRVTGDLWIGDVGGSVREEVDMAAADNQGVDAGKAKNFGWVVHEGSTCHTPNPQANNCEAYVAGCNDQGYTMPVSEYVHKPSDVVTGGYVYRGAVAPWRGRYIFGEFGRSEIYALIKVGSDFQKVTLSSGEVSSPASFGEDHNGELYVLGLGDGSVFRLHLEALSNAKCVTRLNDDFRKLSNAVSSHIRSCIDQGTKEKLVGTVDACVDTDPKERLARRAALVEADDDKFCALAPAVGYAGATTGNEAAAQAELDLAADVLGPDLDAGVVRRSAAKATALCQSSVLKSLASCQRTRRMEFLRCKKLAFKENAFVSSEQLADCLTQDPKARVAKQCDATIGKIATRAIANSCVKKGVDLSTAFPGCDTDDPAGLAQCLEIVGACRTCELFDAADALDFDCNPMCVQ